MNNQRGTASQQTSVQTINSQLANAMGDHQVRYLCMCHQFKNYQHHLDPPQPLASPTYARSVQLQHRCIYIKQYFQQTQQIIPPSSSISLSLTHAIGPVVVLK